MGIATCDATGGGTIGDATGGGTMGATGGGTMGGIWAIGDCMIGDGATGGDTIGVIPEDCAIGDIAIGDAPMGWVAMGCVGNCLLVSYLGNCGILRVTVLDIGMRLVSMASLGFSKISVGDMLRIVVVSNVKRLAMILGNSWT